MVQTPLSLYIHTPWCIQKCPYCDFNSHKAPQTNQEDAYIDALIADLASHTEQLSQRQFQTIFIGGGTPSLLSAKAYQRLFAYLNDHFDLKPNIEITLEANPGTVDYERFESYRRIGINRLSMGIQSFNDKHLKKLGRIHSSLNAQTAIQSAIAAGFDNFNLDIMHGLPNQTIEEALEDIETALSFKPPHFSWYQLTIEPNTIFYKQQPKLPDDEVLLEIEAKGKAILKNYQHYEISAFCQPDKYCRHNENYWLFGDYLGIGAGAHSKITQSDGVYRFEKKRMPQDYLKSPETNIQHRRIKPDELAFEFMLMVSRLKRPIPKELFETRTGLSVESIRPQLEKALSLKLISEFDKEITVTEHGFRFLNEFQAMFL